MPSETFTAFVTGAPNLSAPTGISLLPIIDSGITKKINIDNLYASSVVFTQNVKYPNLAVLGNGSNGLLYAQGSTLTDVLANLYCPHKLFDSSASSGSPGQVPVNNGSGFAWASPSFGGFPKNVLRIAMTGLNTSTGWSTSYTPLTNTEFKIELILTCTTAGTGGTATAGISWSDENGSEAASSTSLPLNTRGYITFALPIHAVTSGVINGGVVVAGGTGSFVFSLYVNVIQMF